MDLGTAPTILGQDAETLAPGTTSVRRPPPTPPQSNRQPSAPVTPRHTSAGSSPLSSASDPISGGRFAPGMVIVDRYRIVALAGRGGMGEVYRADDLKLSQTVAIKFLPAALSQDASALARFHSEVRIARQVSHPNVCRVFDIGDIDGVPYLTMEYVDGEDLSSLLRRIGRLSEDKATQIARQICAGLAAAHDRGVVHRDLKPANVMLDGQGKVRITDFGLAGIAADIQGAEVRAGTPAYMAPEQLSGKEVTFKSDLYSLGLILYEILTGKRVYDATTLQELMHLREHAEIASPSTLVRDMSPVLERVILRCLERDPALRPGSAMQVAAALPGGDPLAAALAAGETPSPEMVAASGQTEGLNPRIGLLLLFGTILSLGLFIFLSRDATMVSLAPFGEGRDVLASKARATISSFGISNAAADSAQGFDWNHDYLREIADSSKTVHRWDVLRNDEPPAVLYWYRESPEYMQPLLPGNNLLFGRVKTNDPPMETSGMREVVTTPAGRLLYFMEVPPQLEEKPAGAASPPDWKRLLIAGGFDPASLHSVAPEYYPLAWGDARAAWEGKYPGRSDIPVRVEAAAFHGEPIYFEVISPWDHPSRMPDPKPASQQWANQWFQILILASIIFVGIAIVRRNIRSNRGDLRGASRLAAFILVVGVLYRLLLAHHTPTPAEFFLIVMAIGNSLFFAFLSWVLYMALEPYVRRHWPHTLISWTRMLAGHFRDPIVARDILIGTFAGIAMQVLDYLQPLLATLFHQPQREPATFSLASLDGIHGAIAVLLSQTTSALTSALAIFFLLFVFRLLLRKIWLAAPVVILIFMLPNLSQDTRAISMIVGALLLAVFIFVLYRFGLLALATAVFANNITENLPVTWKFTEWYAAGGRLAILAIVLMALYSFHYSRAGKPIFQGSLLD